MLLTLTTLVLSSGPAPTPRLTPPARRGDPSIRLTLSSDAVRRGDRVRVRVKAAADGYVVVLRQDASGRVRVVFPVDPDDSTFVRAGREWELRGRGGREAFTVDEGEGTGTVLAAWSATPFHFDSVTRNAHWDYAALSAARDSGDAETTLVGVTERLTAQHFDYDLVSYAVGDRVARRRTAGWYDPWYDPWYSPCFGFACGPFLGPRIGFRAGVVFGGSAFRGRRRWR